MERDGYSALNMIFGENHPNLEPIPLSLTDTPPIQRTAQNIYEFWIQYQDFLHLKSWIENIEQDLNKEDQVDLFLTKCQNSAYLRRESITDRRLDPTAFETRYTGTRLPTTIQQFLDTARYRDGSIQPLRFYNEHSPPTDEPRTTATSRSGPTATTRSGPTYRIRQLMKDDCDQGPTSSVLEIRPLNGKRTRTNRRFPRP
jgi:hypothetical protein